MPCLLETAKRGRRGLLCSIGNDEIADIFAVDGDAKSRAIEGTQCANFRLLEDSQINHQKRIADGNLVTVDNAGNSLPGNGLEVARLGKFQLLLCRSFEDGLAQRMLTGQFQTGGEAEKLGVIGQSIGQADNLRLAFGERAGFIDDEGVDFFENLKRLGIFDQDAGASAAAHANHDRHRRGETQGARAGDDEDGDGVDQGVREPRLRAEERPGNERDGSDGDDDGDEPFRYSIGETLDWGAAALGLSDELHDAREQRFGADTFGVHDERAGGVEGCPDNFAVW